MSEIDKVLGKFNESVNFLIQQSVRNPIFEKVSKKGNKYFVYPYPRIRKSFYCSWKQRF